MGKHADSIDARAFARMAKLFAAKRDALAPDAIEALASDIVDRLSRSAADRPRFEDIAIDADSVETFCNALIEPDPAAALRFIEARRAAGVTRQGVYLGYIPAAARRLGEGWEQNRLSFAEVTSAPGISMP